MKKTTKKHKNYLPDEVIPPDQEKVIVQWLNGTLEDHIRRATKSVEFKKQHDFLNAIIDIADRLKKVI